MDTRKRKSEKERYDEEVGHERGGEGRRSRIRKGGG